MTNAQWDSFKNMVRKDIPQEPLVGFIIDSPWLPGWYGCSTLDYYTDDRVWLAANTKVVQTFPDILFVPGFWSEYGMCSEPSAFGSKCIWNTHSLPHAQQIYHTIEDIGTLKKPHVHTDGLLPFIVNRLKRNYDDIRRIGHDITMAVSRGPFNIASFLMGTTEFLTGCKTHPEEIGRFLDIITDFVIDWIAYQLECFPSMEGILLLDDIIGFVGKEDFETIMTPYLTKIFSSFPTTINMLHNDAYGLICAPYLSQMGIDVFNFSFEHSLQEMREATGDTVTLFGNIAPRDVLALGSLEEISDWVHRCGPSSDHKERIIWSCGGGMPQDVTSERINLFEKEIRIKEREHNS